MLLKIIFLLLFVLRSTCDCIVSNPSDLSFKNNTLKCDTETNIPLLINETITVSFLILDENIASRLPSKIGKINVQKMAYMKTQDIPTVGGKFDVLLFYYASFDSYFKFPLLKYSNGEPFNPEGPKDNGSCVFYTINFPKGCGSGQFVPFFYNYQKPKLFNNEAKLIYKTFTVLGNNLNGTKIWVTNNKTHNVITSEFLNEENNKIEFEYDQFMYYGNWTVFLDICNLKNESFNFPQKPEIYTWESVSGDTGGIVTIYGKYITTKNDTVPTITIGNQNCINVKYITTKNPVPIDQEIISCELGRKNESGPLLVKMKFEDEEATKGNFQYDQPTIFSVIQIKSEINNDKNMGKFLIKGKKFKSSNISTEVMIPNNQTYKSEMWYGKSIAPINETDIIVDLPLSSFPGYIKLVANRGQTSEVESQIFSNFIIEPIITKISPGETKGSIITISGTSIHAFDFNKTPIDIKVYISENICTDISNGDGSFITCTAPSGIGKNLPTKIIIPMANYIQNDLTFSYYPPLISNVEQVNENRIQIFGNNFGNISSGAVISLDNNKNIEIVSIDHNLIAIDLPETTNSKVELKVTIGTDPNDNLISQTSDAFNLPIIPFIGSVSNVDCSGGLITITGLHLNNDMKIYFNPKNPKRKQIPCPNVKTNTTKLATCYVYGKNGQIGNSTTYTSGKNFKVLGNYANKDLFIGKNAIFSFNPPTISSVPVVTKLILDAPFKININGTNFNRNDLSVIIGEDNIICKFPLVEKEFRTISCSLPTFKLWKGYSKELFNSYYNKTTFINVTVDGQYTTHPFHFELFGANPDFKEGSAVGIIVGVVISGIIAAATIIFISVYKYNRYIRLKTIKKILEKNL
ncbi:expressed protein [Dictyostelium purpureum]|uniref:Expressed protein n=1 Tax=Dictyostelium purpureum TaxID=5786 RepID=F0ZRN4_DICPU|nr:uncharacterized protein DICPUDRAFT_98570 [Dictyostelium purpureum]EGC33401.1 expressed protein [Dictyostelium purpureum]|eukprot:XP_003290065.1 expressed protein [Dictyostelium purpureum]